MKGYAWYVAIMVAILVLIVMAELGQPRQVDWSPWFSRVVRAPYGTYLLYDLLPSTIPNQGVTPVAASTYEALIDGAWDQTAYVVIAESYDADDQSVEELLDFVDAGNDAFIAAEKMPDALLDSIGMTLNRTYFPDSSRVEARFVNPRLAPPRSFQVRSDMVDYTIEQLDTARTGVLATLADGRPILARVGWGAGSLYISTTPYLFTNYAIVDTATAQYPFTALSHLGGREIYWDDYYNPARSQVTSPLRYVLSQAPLAWSYYLAIATAVLFVFVYGRRRQRIVPVIKPHPNLTLEFVKTVGQLYHQHGDHRNLADKKIMYLLDHIHTRYGLRAGAGAGSGSARTPELFERLAARSGRPLASILSLFETIDEVERKPRISAAELAVLASKIDSFYTNRTAS